ncbi:MAG TPA: diaminopimelate epimerase [Acidimicrobiales bacterium]
MTTLALTKHHGLGNDFLVAFADGGPADRRWEPIARAACDRRHGIGADGLLVATPLHPAGGANGADGAVVAMRLYNADGSEAEMSGNGIRCLVQAWARRAGQDAGEVVVSTVAGPRTVSFGPGPDRHTMVATVDMGVVAPMDAPAGWPDVGAHAGRPVAHVNVGNPHTVVAVDDVTAVDLAAIGQQVPGVNLEIVEPGPEPDAVTMRVHERGAGITEACGTGACAAAWAAHAWGLARPSGGEITVHMDGGDARVRLDEPAPGRVTLIGPAMFVGTIEVEL